MVNDQPADISRPEGPERRGGGSNRRRGNNDYRLEALAGGQGLYEGDYTSVAGGKTHYGRLQTFSVRNPEGQKEGGLGIIQDLSDYQRLHLEHQRLGDLYKALSEANTVILHATETEGLFRDVCRVCTERVGLDLAFVSRHAAGGKCLEVVMSTGRLAGYLEGPLPDLPGIEAPWDASEPCRAAFPLLCEGEVVNGLNLYSTEPGFFSADRLDLLREIAGDCSSALERFRREARRQEAEEAFRATLSLLHDLSGAPTFFVNVIEDLTAQKQTDAERQGLVERLHQAQKMESLGTLCAGVAHDMNNILAAILGEAAIHPDRSAGRGLGGVHGEGQWARDEARYFGQGHGSLLYDPAGGQGNGAWPDYRLRRGQSPRGQSGDPQRIRPGDPDLHALAGGPREGGAGASPAGPGPGGPEGGEGPGGG